MYCDASSDSRYSETSRGIGHQGDPKGCSESV